MSSDDVWYFLKGQESTGPFSKAILQQIHEGGQLPPETLVWREGMDGWKAAEEVSELEIPKKTGTSPSAAAPSSPGPSTSSSPAAPSSGADRLKLKLKPKEPAPAPSTMPVTIPAPKVPGKEPIPPGGVKLPGPAPSVIPKGIVSEKDSTRQSTAADKKKRKVDDGPPLWKRAIQYIFSSLFLTPVFLIACGWMIWLYKSRFPDVLWFVWMAVGLGGFGVLSLVGIRALDGYFRILCLLLLAPPLVLLWPVIMRENDWQTVPASHWIFLGLCLSYCLTTRIGLRAYTSRGLGAFAILTGLLTLGFISAVAKSIWTPPHWEQLVASGDHIRLPPPIARAINKPEWATAIGLLQLGNGRHKIESALFKQMNNGEFRLIIKTVDELYFAAKIKTEAGPIDPQKIIGQNFPVVFAPESDKAELDPEKARSIMLDGKKTETSSATLRVDNITGDIWRGTLNLELTPGKETPVTSIPGSFETTVKMP